jgi:hypothetical protein
MLLSYETIRLLDGILGPNCCYYSSSSSRRTQKTADKHQRLHVGTGNKGTVDFTEWLVGFTDGDGTFSMTLGKNNSWQFTFKIGISAWNYRALYHMKKNLGCGSITADGTTILQFRIRDTKHLAAYLFPHFDKFPLRTSKYYDYLLFKEAVLDSTKRAHNAALLKIGAPSDYDAPFSTSITKSWLVGFTEAEGSFYLTQKETGRIVHGFGITQKLDKQLLETIRQHFGIKAQVKLNKAMCAWIIDTTSNRVVEHLKDYFRGTFVGIKSLQFRIWERSHTKHKGNYMVLLKVQNQMRLLRKAVRVNSTKTGFDVTL